MKKSKSKLIYEIIFISVIVLSFFAWVLHIRYNGYESEQLGTIAGLWDFWADFINPVGYSAQGDPYNNLAYVGWEHKQQSPLAYLMFWQFSHFVDQMDGYTANGYFLPMYTDKLFLVMFFLFFAFLFIMIFELIRIKKDGNQIIRFGTAIAVLMSWPVLYTFERGNHVLVAVVFFMIYLFFYGSKNAVVREMALVALAVGENRDGVGTSLAGKACD